MLRNSGRSLILEDDSADGDDSGEWIMSYADTVTLLLCFFIIFFAEYKKKSEKDLLLDLTQNFSQSSKSEGEQGRQKAQMLSEIESEVRSKLGEFEVKKIKLGIIRRRKEILVRLYERDFFHIGSYHLKENGKKVLEGVSALLAPFQDKVLLKVEGHSDSLPVNPFSPYKTNLNLSSLRASQAANVLISNGLLESKIRVIGYGSAKRIVDDRTPASEGGKYIPQKGLKNRRIEIRIQTLDDRADQFMNVNI